MCVWLPGVAAAQSSGRSRAPGDGPTVDELVASVAARRLVGCSRWRLRRRRRAFGQRCQHHRGPSAASTAVAAITAATAAAGFLGAGVAALAAVPLDHPSDIGWHVPGGAQSEFRLFLVDDHRHWHRAQIPFLPEPGLLRRLRYLELSRYDPTRAHHPATLPLALIISFVSLW